MTYQQALIKLYKLRKQGKLTQEQYKDLVVQAGKKYGIKGEITPVAASTEREVVRVFTGDLNNLDDVVKYFSDPVV